MSDSQVYRNHHFDSTKWEAVKPRDDDIIIVTAYKSGTTWMQQILSELIFRGGEKPASLGDMSPWVDLRVPPAEVLGPLLELQTWRRFLKTHLPADAFEPYFKKTAKYIYVGRDGRDAFMSLLNHWEHANDAWYGGMNDSPGLVGPPVPKYHDSGCIQDIFDAWLSKGSPTLPNEQDGYPFWSFFHNASTWWDKATKNPNILLVHFNDLKADLQGQMMRISKFLDIEVDQDHLPEMVKACTFDEMKKNADAIAPLNGMLWNGGSQTFIFKGTNERWKGVLREDQLAAYEAKVKESLSADCAAWFANGGFV